GLGASSYGFRGNSQQMAQQLKKAKAKKAKLLAGQLGKMAEAAQQPRQPRPLPGSLGKMAAAIQQPREPKPLPGQLGKMAAAAQQPRESRPLPGSLGKMATAAQAPKQSRPLPGQLGKMADAGKLRRDRTKAKRANKQPEITPISETMLSNFNTDNQSRENRDQQKNQSKQSRMPGRPQRGRGMEPETSGGSTASAVPSSREAPHEISENDEKQAGRELAKQRKISHKAKKTAYKGATWIVGRQISGYINKFLISTCLESIPALLELVGFITYFAALFALNLIMFGMGELAKQKVLDLLQYNPLASAIPGPLKAIVDKNMQVIRDLKLGMRAGAMLSTIGLDLATLLVIVIILFIILLPFIISGAIVAAWLDFFGLADIFGFI
ncbi:hypothetical protein KKF29_01970, partial [Patescibacteria group bacterium]|nr:hypothetical protein [Patescibacteria group bacterium]